ncbi:hypothetical protein TNCV_3322431 [Trichonephila clavipes]|nr:hypothetical protein TNCV_3322431 [Trichonephila clavipes]
MPPTGDSSTDLTRIATAGAFSVLHQVVLLTHPNECPSSPEDGQERAGDTMLSILPPRESQKVSFITWYDRKKTPAPSEGTSPSNQMMSGLLAGEQRLPNRSAQ